MRLSPDQAAKTTQEYWAVAERLQRLPLDLLNDVSPKLKSERAREYLSHGIGRRLGLISRCLTNVFRIFPPARTALLSKEELDDVHINLHAFVINIYGILDNVAWMLLCERDMQDKMRRTEVGLFNRSTQQHLPETIASYVNSETIRSWFADYAKNYRDALAHRVPLYVPPYSVKTPDAPRYQELDGEIWRQLLARDLDAVEKLKTEKDALCTICAVFIHSYSDSDQSRPVAFHPQMICDVLTVEELLGKVSALYRASTGAR